MIRGWRNDPRWVAIYAKRDEDRMKRQIERFKLEVQMQQVNADLEASLRRLRSPRPLTTHWDYA